MITTALRYANASSITTNLWIGGDIEMCIPAMARPQLEEIDAVGITDIEDACDWWLRKRAANSAERREGRQCILDWRRENELDVTTIIRRIRSGETIALGKSAADHEPAIAHEAGDSVGAPPALMSISQIVERYRVARKTVMRWKQAGQAPTRSGDHPQRV